MHKLFLNHLLKLFLSYFLVFEKSYKNKIHRYLLSEVKIAIDSFMIKLFINKKDSQVET